LDTATTPAPARRRTSRSVVVAANGRWGTAINASLTGVMLLWPICASVAVWLTQAWALRSSRSSRSA
jgi:hypothetical protein